MCLCTLQELQGMQVDMFTTVFNRNSQTRVIDGRMVTPRGYRYKGAVVCTGFVAADEGRGQKSGRTI